jgi:hypothetical protein
LTPIAINAISRASVPLVTPMAFLEFGHRGPENQGLCVADFIDRAAYFLPDRRVLRLQIEQFNFHHCSVRHGPLHGKRERGNPNE